MVIRSVKIFDLFFSEGNYTCISTLVLFGSTWIIINWFIDIIFNNWFKENYIGVLEEQFLKIMNRVFSSLMTCLTLIYFRSSNMFGPHLFQGIKECVGWGALQGCNGRLVNYCGFNGGNTSLAKLKLVLDHVWIHCRFLKLVSNG
jgi:hypothetical protein